MQQISQAKTIRIFLFAFLLFAAGTTNAQVGIGTPSPNASAQLDVNSTNKGFLPPRMTLSQRNAIVSPTAGLTIWCKDCGVLGELQVYNGGSWTNMTGGYSSAPIPATVTIGTQVWMTKNLDVVTYRNGDTIPEVKDSAQWANLTTGAWCYYNNDPALGAIYGKLYNRAAVVDSRGLAPVGWHVPSDSYDDGGPYGAPPEGGAEWKTLGIFLGGDAMFYGAGGAGLAGKMIATSLWNSHLIATNESGFTGLPGGQRNPDGSFSSIGNVGRWWSTGEYSYFLSDHTYTWVHLYYPSVELSSNGYDLFNILYQYNYYFPFPPGNTVTSYPAGYGLSVRCVKD